MRSAKSEWNYKSFLLVSRAASIMLGIGLLIWGAMPAMMERIINGDAPSLYSITSGLIDFVFGVVFLGLGGGLKRGLRGALWTANLLALALITLTVGGAMVARTADVPVFVLVLGTVTIFGTWQCLRSNPAQSAR